MHFSRSAWGMFLFLATGCLGLQNQTSTNFTYASDEMLEMIKKYRFNEEQIEELFQNAKSFNQEQETEHAHKSHGVKVADFKWDYVKEPLVLTGFFITIGLFKLAYHHTRYTRKILPESCCLIILGVIIGFLFIGDETHASIQFLEFDSKIFFLFLLPPIILESAYSLKDRAFLDNLRTIVLYAVLGTILNIMLIGGFLTFFIHFNLLGHINLPTLDIFVFASLIAAVDPVAVLAVFQEVGVNKMLYFMVFGESLLNDAVTIVCYNLAIEFKDLSEVDFTTYLLGFGAFLTVSVGGVFIGLICGALSSVITKFTKDVRVVEPVTLFGMSYLAYIGSELFHFSGIIGMIVCGLFQTHYACCNISYKSFSTVMYFTKVMSSLSESLIFIILGVMLVNEREWFWTDWHPLFSIVSTILCVCVRFLVTFSLTAIVNRFTGGVRHISHEEQVIMSYGGLRGAVSFSLAFMIHADAEIKNTILSATYMVIIFTVFFQGSTIKFLVKMLNIGLASKDESYRLFREFNKGMVDHLCQGVEDLCGYKNYNYITHMSYFSKKFIRPALIKNYKFEAQKEVKLVEIDRACTMREAMINSPSQGSFKRQQTIDEMAESGMSMDFLDDEHRHRPHISTADREAIEKTTEELTKDISTIRQLMNSPFEECYLDKNLTHEEEKEQKRMEHVTNLKTRAEGISGVKRKKFGMFRKKKSVRRNATQQGLIHSAIASLEIQVNHENEPSTSGIKHTVTDEEEGLNMNAPEEHPLVTISENAETSF